MHKLFGLRNIFTVLLLFSISIIFLLLFMDILKNEEFSIGLTTVPLLIIGIILLLWSTINFIKNTNKELPNNTIILLLLLSIVISILIQSIVVTSTKKNAPQKVDRKDDFFTNPMYSEYMKVAEKYDLNLSFTKNVWEEKDFIDFKRNTIYEQKAKSIDILFFGDSSIAWGLIPQVIEQITGKKVAMFAYQSNMLNQETSKIFNQISKYYLKKDGIIILSFENWTLNKNPTRPSTRRESQLEMFKWSDTQFNTFIANYNNNKELIQLHKLREKGLELQKIEDSKLTESIKTSYYEEHLSFNAFKKFYDKQSNMLSEYYYFSLKSPSLYDKYIEKIINRRLYEKKLANQSDNIEYIRWDYNTVTAYSPTFTTESIYSDLMPTELLIAEGVENIKTNAQLASKIYGKHKIFTVPLYNAHENYQLARNLYYEYYQKYGFDLCDLGKIHPKKFGYTMFGGSHMGNTGGLMKSILVAKWLKSYLKGKGLD